MKPYLKPLAVKLITALLLVIVVIIIHSCRKDITMSNQSVVVKTLTSHHISISELQKAYTAGVKANKLKTADISQQAIANIIGTLNVDWTSYTLQEFPDSTQIIEFPMPDDSTLIAPSDSIQTGNNKYRSKTSAVFILHKDTITLNFFMKTIEDQNDPGYQSVIDQQYYLNTPGGFNGEVLYFTLDRQFINGYLWKNGSITKAVSIGNMQPPQQTQTIKGKLKTDALTNCVEDTYEVVDITTVTTPYGSTTTVTPTGISFSIITCDVTGGGTSNIIGGVSGGGTPPPTPPPPCTPGSGAAVSSVKNGRLVINVTTGGSGSGSGGTTTTQPCLTNPTKPVPVPPPTTKINTDTLSRNFPCAIQLVLNKLLATKSYNDFVAPFETNAKPDLIWSDKDLSWNPNGGGATMLGNTQVDPNSGIGLGALITINNKMLQNSSRLMIAAAFIHETIHAYVNYDVTYTNESGNPNFKFNGSWLNELDFFYDQNALPTQYRDHYEMMTDYFDQAISILALFDNNAHTTQQYAMAMLFGLNTADPNCTSTEVSRLTQEYNTLMQQYGITSAQLNSFWASQLSASATDKLSTNCPQP